MTGRRAADRSRFALTGDNVDVAVFVLINAHLGGIAGEAPVQFQLLGMRPTSTVRSAGIHTNSHIHCTCTCICSTDIHVDTICTHARTYASVLRTKVSDFIRIVRILKVIF